MQPTYYTTIESPIGALMLVGDDVKLRGLHFVEGRRRREPEPGWVHDPAPLAYAERQIAEYFAGSRRVFDLPLETGGTPFQRAVWSALEQISYGETISYGMLAERIGNPRAVRAVGLANGSNPIALVIPCHRVIGANGSLVGYGGGLDRKTYLIDFERRMASRGEPERLVSGGLALQA